MDKSVVEFLNILSYKKDKSVWEKESIRNASKIK